MFSASWSSTDLAQAVCDDLVKSHKLNQRFRGDREDVLARIFDKVGLDGQAMGSFDNPGPLLQLVRSATQSEPWVDGVIDSLIGMLPPDVARREQTVVVDDQTNKELNSVKERTAQRAQRHEAKSGGKGLDACYNCGESGHLARDCPEKGSRKGKGKDRRSDDKCYVCGEYGHISRNCPDKGRGKGRGDDQCYNCKGYGHLARDCPERSEGRKGKSRGKGDGACFVCGGFGHLARDCPEGGKDGRRGKGRGGYDDDF